MFPKQRIVYFRLVSLWLGLIAMTVPIFYFGMPSSSISEAVLESAASWTATGIGAYDSSSMPLWLSIFRSLCNWIGGVGIFTIYISFLMPRRKMGWAYAAAEFPGSGFLKSESGFRMNYRRIVLLYAAFSATQFILLLISGMSAPDALMSALSNTVTAGLHHINNGIVTALPIPVKVILTAFAFAGSITTMLFVYLLRRKWNLIKNSSELKFYLAQILLSTLVIAIFISTKTGAPDVFTSLGAAIMQTISSFSTAGYVIADVGKWPLTCIMIIVLQAFIGACSLSTGGGIKVGRVVIAAKTSVNSLYRHIHPNSVRSLTFDKKPLKSDQVVTANIFVALFFMTYLLGALLLSIDNISLTEALNYSQAMLTGSGISLGSLEHAGLATGFSAYGRTVLSILMIAGRLEIYPLLMLFFRGFWKTE